jgi:hypothetical protein
METRMAEIKVERKEGPPIVPILLGVLAVVAIIAALIWFTGNDEPDRVVSPTAPTDTPAAQATSAERPQEVAAYRQQCADAGAFRDEMGMEHEHEANCMRLLADGLDAVVRRDEVAGAPMEQRVRALRQRAEQITADPAATDHANRVRGAAMEAAEIIEYMAREREAVGVNLQQHAQQTRQAAEQIDPGTLLLEQRDRTSAFFTRAGDALDGLAASRARQ